MPRPIVEMRLHLHQPQLLRPGWSAPRARVYVHAKACPHAQRYRPSHSPSVAWGEQAVCAASQSSCSRPLAKIVGRCTTRGPQQKRAVPRTRPDLISKKGRQRTREKVSVTSSRACAMPSARCATSNASTLPVSMTSGITLAAMRTAMKIDAIGSKPVQP